ncbi:phytoene desaturase family protein [Epibacterium sp. Ofav1-8]|uniref:phytoene desaturase family protein n=1 Tax=Epibacterium sp. Ofav1-8 TaxID=2917735 RepID=UPI001EF5F15B|nr:NAD(P)/FAD-dependent oxidoreductase [Epibacterium sp. Ofav1-8]
MSENYDAIIVGAGHNGLVTQAYLQRAGLKTISLERGAVAGGGLSTVEFPGREGFKHNTHAYFHRGIPQTPWFKDLELEKHGVEYYSNDLYVTILLDDGNTLEWWNDFEKTYASFARISKADADKLRWWRERFVSITRDILAPEARQKPVPADVRRERLEQTEDGRFLLEVSQLSPFEFVQREFKHPTIQGGLLFINGMREVDLRAKGFGHHIASLFATPARVQTCRGGSNGLAQGLVRAVQAAGGTVRTNAPVKRMIVEDGRCAGVELESGEVIRASRLVASALNPNLTFGQMLDKAHLPPELEQKVDGFQYNKLGPLFAIHLDLDEPPIYSVSDKKPWVQDSLMVIMGLNHVDDFVNMAEAHDRNQTGHQVLWGGTPTMLDPSQAPAGKHTAFMWEKTPFALDGDPENWRSARGPHGATMFDLWCKFAPNLRNATLAMSSQSPLDTEEQNPNMRAADVLMGSFSNGQVGINRPFPGFGEYRTHIDSLYLCGSACHPGGNITGYPGLNSAREILQDLDLGEPK